MQSPEFSDIRRQPLPQYPQRQPRIWISNTSSNDASKSSNAKIIRSHAAKEGHYRQRERRRGHLEVRQYQPTVPSNKHKRYTSEGENGTQTQIRPQTTSHTEPQGSLSCYRRDPSQHYAGTISHAENEHLLNNPELKMVPGQDPVPHWEIIFCEESFFDNQGEIDMSRHHIAKAGKSC
ncbi:hypothetical protein GGI42DRAFT_333725 [Trichoderma sp. SZMC 28013]